MAVLFDTQIVQRVLCLSMLNLKTNAADIVGEDNKVVLKKFDRDPAKCRGIIIDRWTTDLLTLRLAPDLPKYGGYSVFRAPLEQCRQGARHGAP